MQTDLERTDMDLAASAPVEAPAAPRRRSIDDSIPVPVVAALGGAWIAGLVWLFSITPAADPEAPIGAIDLFMSTAMFASWLAVFGGLGARRRLGVGATIVGGGLLAFGGVLCGLTGHTGLWIAAQIGIGLGLTSLGVVANRLT